MRARIGVGWIGVVLVTAVAVQAAPAQAVAQTFTVTTTADSGAGSFDQAVKDANANPGEDTIVFAAGTNGITIVDTALDDITGSVVINGNGVGVTRLQNATKLQAFANTGSASVRLTISGLTMTGTGGLGAQATAAGDSVDLIATNVTVDTSAGLVVYGLIGSATATLTNVALTSNGRLFFGSNSGSSVATANSLTMTGTGGLTVQTNTGLASLTASNVTMSGGGGITIASYPVGIATGSFTGLNLTGATGDAIAVYAESGTATINLTDSVVSGSGAESLDLFRVQPEAPPDASSELSAAAVGGVSGTISGTLFKDNKDSIDVDDATLNLINSTVSGVLDDDAFDVQASGTLNLTNVTVVGYDDDGMDISPSGTVRMRNTAFGPSTDGGDVCAGSAAVTTFGGNRVADATCDDLDGPNDQENVANLLLGPLADNGGPTNTHLPQAGSPLIDGGVNTDCPADDQRDVARPQDGNNDAVATCDSGAVEVITPKTDLSMTKSADVAETTLAGTVVWTLLIKNESATAAADVVVNDTLPSELELVSVTPPAGWSCVGSAPGAPPVVNCTKPSLAPGESAAIQVATRVVTLFGAEIVNSAYVGASNAEVTVANNTGIARVQVGELPETGFDANALLPWGLGLVGFGLAARSAARHRRPAIR